MNNYIFDVLCRAGICDQEHITKVQGYVRDREDIDVWKCNKSSAIFLSDTAHMDMKHYDEKPPTHMSGSLKRQIIATNDDSQRRYDTLKNVVRSRNWLDVGTGSGAVLDVLGPLASSFAAVEPQAEASSFLKELGYDVYRRLSDVPSKKYEVATLFHVFEHLVNPDQVLKEVSGLLDDDGMIVIEVPHARDFLIEHSGAFREHTFWSEHLFLHTRETLNYFVRENGFEVLAIEAVQRYPIANHFHWLIKEQGKGQIEWPFLNDQALCSAYESVLAKNDFTDTLVLYGKKSR